MQIKQFFISRRYLIKIFLLVSVILLVIPIYSRILYYKIEDSLMKYELENSEKMLVQAKNSISNMHDIIRNICIVDYYSNDVKSLMYMKDEETYENLLPLERIKVGILGTNYFIHSLYIYNNFKKTYYSTIYPPVHHDIVLEDLLKSYTKVPVLKPLIRKIATLNSNGTYDYSRVMTYIYYESTGKNNMMDGAVILNVKIDWLFNSIKEVNGINGQSVDSMFIMDQKGEFIKYEENNFKFNDELKDSFIRKTTEKSSSLYKHKSGYYSEQIEGKKYFISYINLEREGWTVLKIRLYEDIRRSLNGVAIFMLVMTIVFMLLAIILVFFTTRKIYEPVAKILNDLKGGKNDSLKNQNLNTDEISYIRETIKDTFNELDRHDKEKSSTRHIIRNYFLRRLILESNSVKKEEFEISCIENGLALKAEGEYCLCLIEIDRFKEMRKNSNDHDIEIFKFAICNICSEILANDYINEAADISESIVAVIINIPTGMDTNILYGNLKNALNMARDHIVSYFGFSFSAAISECVCSFNHISKVFYSTSENLLYKYIYGYNSIIIPEMVSRNTSNEAKEYSFKNETRFIEMVKTGDSEGAEDKLCEIFNDFKTMNYTNMVIYSQHLINSLRDMVFEINKFRQEPLEVSQYLSSTYMAELNTIDELYECILKILKGLEGSMSDNVNVKHKTLAQTIKELIDANYYDNSLNAATIADMLKISNTHAGRVFKEVFGMTIPEYTNDVRLSKAVKWLENSKLSINDVMLKVGIENQSYFYKLFKSKFGVTPREYLQRMP